MATFRKNGLIMVGPDKPGRDSYTRVSVQVNDDRGRTPDQAWNDACAFASEVYGPWPTEDGTIGQHAQLIGASNQYRDLPTKNRQFTFGLNLYGYKIRPVHARIRELLLKQAGRGLVTGTLD